MQDSELLTRYNYESFTDESYRPWMRFAQSPPLGAPVDDFPLWNLDQSATSLRAVWTSHDYCVIEFGSFT